MVSPVSSSIRFCIRAKTSAGKPWLIRSVPERSSQASSSERGCTRGVRVCSRPMIRLLSKVYLLKSGLITTACGQALRALNMGIAERTP